jgi:hypothetical protein
VFTKPPLISLSLLNLFSRWPIMQKVRRYLFVCIIYQASTDCKHGISRFFFTPFLGFFFTFPSRYLYTIGQMIILRLRGWSPFIQTKIVFRFTHFLLCYIKTKIYWNTLQGFHLLWQVFPLLYFLIILYQNISFFNTNKINSTSK